MGTSLTARPLARVLPVIALLLVGACGRTASSSDTGPAEISHPTAADQPILSVVTAGGFVPMEVSLTTLPGFTLAGDGSIYTPGPMIEIYPPPAVPAFQVQTVDEAGIQAILHPAKDAGLLEGDRSFQDMFVSDMPTTTFTVTADDVEHTTSVYALENGSEHYDEPQRSQLQKIERFNEKLSDLASWLPKGSLGEQQVYDPLRMQLFVLPAPATDPQMPQQPVEWPLAEPLSGFGAPDSNGNQDRCGIVAGDDLAALLDTAKGTNTMTPWTSDGKRYQVLFRPLLPTELGCVAPVTSTGGATP